MKDEKIKKIEERKTKVKKGRVKEEIINGEEREQENEERKKNAREERLCREIKKEKKRKRKLAGVKMKVRSMMKKE